MIRWQGTTMGIGLAPLAAPTARTAEGAPMELAMSRYEAVRPAPIARRAVHTRR